MCGVSMPTVISGAGKGKDTSGDRSGALVGMGCAGAWVAGYSVWANYGRTMGEPMGEPMGELPLLGFRA